MLCLAIGLTDLQSGESRLDSRIPFAMLNQIRRFIPVAVEEKLQAHQLDIDALIESAKSKIQPCKLVDVEDKQLRLVIEIKPVLGIGYQDKLDHNP